MLMSLLYLFTTTDLRRELKPVQTTFLCHAVIYRDLFNIRLIILFYKEFAKGHQQSNPGDLNSLCGSSCFYSCRLFRSP